MTTAARIGWGSVFQTFNGISWVTLGELIDFTMTGMSRDVIDAGHESMPSEWRGIVPGLKSGGEAAVQINFTESEYQKLHAELDSDTIWKRRFVFPDGTTFQFNAILTSLETGVGIGERVSTSAKFKIDGKPGSLFQLPTVGGVLPFVYADFVNHSYVYNDVFYDDVYAWTAAMGGSFTRTSTGTFATARNSAGVIEAYADNVIRFDHDAGGNPLGVLLEDAKINLITNSLTMSSVSAAAPNTLATSTDIVAPYPAATVKKATRSGVGDTNMGSLGIAAGGNIVTTNYYFSCYVWIPADATITNITVSQEQASAPWNVADTTWAVADVSIRDRWQKVHGFITSGASGTAQCSVVMRATAASGDFFYTTMWQLERSHIHTSFIPTDASQRTRGQEPFITGIPLYQTGTALAVCDVESNALSAFQRVIASADSTTPFMSHLYIENATGKAGTYTGAAGLTTGNVAASGAVRRMAHSWNEDGRSLCLDAGTVVTSSTPNSLGGFIVWGSTGTGGSFANHICGHIRELALWKDVKASNAQLQTITTP